MATAYGPWSLPPACNASEQCQILLNGANPGSSVGRATCFASLIQSDQGSYGGCACESTFGLGGSTCNEATSATPMVIASTMIPLGICALIILRFGRTLFGICSQPSIWRMNAAGTSYALAWFGLLSSLAQYILNATRPFLFSEAVLTVSTVTGRMQVIFMAVAVLNLAAAFIEMSSSVKLINNVHKLRIPMAISVLAFSCLIIFTYLFTSSTIAAAVGFVVVFFLAVLGIVGPVLLYTRSTSRLMRAENMPPPTKQKLLMAIMSDICLGNRQMKRLLGFTRSESSNSKDSKESLDSRDTPPTEVASLGPKRQSKERINKNSALILKREEKMVSFLSRAVNMGFWLSSSLVAFLVAVAVGIPYAGKFEDGTFRRNRITGMVSDIALVSALYQILWFLNLGYKRAISQRARVTKYRSESKDIAGSKIESKLEVHDAPRLVHGSRDTENSRTQVVAASPL